MQILDAQQSNYQKYRDTIAARGPLGNWLRLTEEVGELAKAIRNGDKANMEEEAADVLAWLFTVCSTQGVNLEDAYCRKYGDAYCFRCKKVRCECPEKGIPAKV